MAGTLHSYHRLPLASHCPALTHLVLSFEGFVGVCPKYNWHADLLVLIAGVLHVVHICGKLRTLTWLIRTTNPKRTGLDVNYHETDDYDGDEAGDYWYDNVDFCNVSKPFSSLACHACLKSPLFHRIIDQLESTLLQVEHLERISVAFYKTCGASMTDKEIVKLKKIFPRLDKRGLIRALPDGDLVWDHSDYYDFDPRPSVRLLM